MCCNYIYLIKKKLLSYKYYFIWMLIQCSYSIFFTFSVIKSGYLYLKSPSVLGRLSWKQAFFKLRYTCTLCTLYMYIHVCEWLYYCLLFVNYDALKQISTTTYRDPVHTCSYGNNTYMYVRCIYMYMYNVRVCVITCRNGSLFQYSSEVCTYMYMYT